MVNRCLQGLLATLAVLVGCEGAPTPPTQVAASLSSQLSAQPATSASQAPVAAAPAACELTKKPLYWVGWAKRGARLVTVGKVVVPDAVLDAGKPTEDGAVDIWDLERGARISGHSLGFGSSGDRPPLFAFTPDGKGVVSGGLQGDLVGQPAYWDIAAGSTTFVKERLSFPESVTVAQDGSRAVISGGAAQLMSLALPSLELVGPTPYSEGHAESDVQFSAEGSVIYTFGGSVELIDAKTLRSIKPVRGVHAANKDGSIIVLFGDRWSGVLDGKGKQRKTFTGAPKITEAQLAVVQVALSPDGKRAVLHGVLDQQTTVWDTETGKQVGSVAPPDAAGVIRFSPDSRVLFLGPQGYDLATLKPTLALQDGFPLFLGQEHTIVTQDKDVLTEIDALTGAPTKRSWNLPGSQDAELRARADGSIIAYHPNESDTVRLVRLSDGAFVDLGVVGSGKDQQGFVRSANKYQGPAGARGCGPGGGNPATHDTLLQDFMAGKPL